jgi:hypothetical protein
MSQAPPTPEAAAPPGSDADAAAHLARLHKMSTTAGVTNIDYVAVNQTAVVALVLGVLSAVALFGPLLLVVPVVGIVFAVVAIRQINDSSGTQTGKSMAWAGLALCVVLGGAEIAREVIGTVSVRKDEERIAATLSQLGKELRAGNYPTAYALFDEDFRGKVTAEAFKQRWEAIQAPTPLGRVVVMEWNGMRPYFEQAGGTKTATARARLKFDNGAEERFEVVMHQVGDKWLVLRFPTVFPDKKPRPGQQDDGFDI